MSQKPPFEAPKPPPPPEGLEEDMKSFVWRVKNYARDVRFNIRDLNAIWDRGVAKTEAEEAIEGFCYQVKDYARTHKLTAEHLRAIFDAGIVHRPKDVPIPTYRDGETPGRALTPEEEEVIAKHEADRKAYRLHFYRLI